MVSNVGDADSSFRIGVQYFGDEVLTLRRQELWHLIIGTHDLLVEIRRLGVFEGQVTGNHSIEDNSRTPNISLQAVIPFASNHL